MTPDTSFYWGLIDAERARILRMLDGLSEQQWHTQSLCEEWTVEDVAAHLTAAATTGRWAWLRSMALAGFSPQRHNARRLQEHLGSTPAETGERFRESVKLTTAPTADYGAWLGEVIVHGQDIARPLGIELTPDHSAVRQVADFFATKDFAVNTRSMIKGVRLEAIDDDFSTGSGPVARGRLLGLVMAMAGRGDYVEELEGDGVRVLRERIA